MATISAHQARTSSSTTGRHRKQTRPDHPGAALAALAWGVVGIPALLVTSTWASGVTPTELDAGTGVPSHSAVAADHGTTYARATVTIHPEQVSDAMNDALSAAGYDDTSVPVPVAVAQSVCVTDTDCAVAGHVWS